MPSRLERRAALVVIGAAALILLLALAIAPTKSPTYDDAKYVGIGRNVLDGNGIVNVFGTIFLKHAPVWPVAIVIPERLLGVHPLVTGHLLNALSAAAVLILVGALGWRIRPALGALAAVTLLGQPYFVDVARTAGIDLPSTAITFAYVLLGFVAVRRNSLVLAALAGLLFGLGFLVKETILPFAPVPFLAAVLWDIRWPSILRLAAATAATAALSTSWWFAMYAAHTGEIYRLGYSASLLAPAGIAAAVFVVLGLAAEPIAARLATGDRSARLSSRFPGTVRRHGRSLAGWALTIGWVIALLWVFNGTSKLQGAGLFNADQLRSYLSQTFVPVSPVFALGVGFLLAIVSLVRDPAAIGQEARALLVTVVCSLPLVALVVAVGEAPRHFLGVMALLGLAGWLGWLDGAYHAIAKRDVLSVSLVIGLAAAALAAVGFVVVRYLSSRWLLTGAVALVIAMSLGFLVAVWLGRRGRLWSTGLPLVIAALLLVAGGTALWRVYGPPNPADTVKTAVAARVNAWIRDNVPPGGVVSIGPYLSMTTALDLPPGHRAVLIRHALAIGDPSAPLGLRGGGRDDPDWIAVDIAPGKANQFLVYEARRVTRQIQANRPAVYVYNLTRERSARSFLGALAPENGFDEVATWSYPVGSDTVETHIFRIDHDRFAIDPHAMFISPKALDRLAGILEREPDRGRRAAATLVSRIVRPADGSLDAGLARLEALAATGP